MTTTRSPILGVEVLSAPLRAARPNAFGTTSAICPFCPGNESETPPAMVQHPSEGPWTIRVVPNRYPFPNDAAVAHEVVIESDDHDAVATAWTGEHLEAVVGVWLDRLAAMRKLDGVDIALMFRNEGCAAGASLAHPHSQIIGLRHVPAMVSARFAEGCPVCADVTTTATVLGTAGDLVAWCPSPSVTPWEIAISSRAHRPLAQRDRHDVREIASLLRAALAGWSRLGITAGNILLQEGSGAEDSNFHWTLSLHPRVTAIAGFELATGTFVNIVTEETAAAALRPSFQ